MDNSPRFDGSTTDLLAVDFSVFFAREAKMLSAIASQLGNQSEAAYWGHAAANVSRAVHDKLYDASSGLYFDFNTTSGQLSGVVASTALLPLWLDDIPPQRVPKLIAALHDPTFFGTKVPIPSTGRSMPTFSTDMWRGPMWVNSNYMTALALEARGAVAEAHALIDATLQPMQEAYLKYGAIF